MDRLYIVANTLALRWRLTHFDEFPDSIVAKSQGFTLRLKVSGPVSRPTQGCQLSQCFFAQTPQISRFLKDLSRYSYFAIFFPLQDNLSAFLAI